MTWVDNKDFKHQRDIQSRSSTSIEKVIMKNGNICINTDIECDFRQNIDSGYGSLTAKLDGKIFATAYKTVGMGEWSIYFRNWNQKGKTWERHSYIYGNVNSAKKAINQVANLTEFFKGAEFIPNTSNGL